MLSSHLEFQIFSGIQAQGKSGFAEGLFDDGICQFIVHHHHIVHL